MRRIQIKESMLSHFEKEEILYIIGIKTLSMFFINVVAKYRIYDENVKGVNSEHGKKFEEEYRSVLNDYIILEGTPYIKYLKGIAETDRNCAGLMNPCIFANGIMMATSSWSRSDSGGRIIAQHEH